MSDHHPLDGFARVAAQHVVAPDFEVLVRTAKRRRHRALAASGCLLTAIVGVVAFGIQSVGTEEGGPARPAPVTSTGPTPPSQTVPVKDMTAEQIVRDPHAYLYRFVVAADNPDVKASAWAVCETRSCETSVEAVSLTSDNYSTARYLLVQHLTDLKWVSGDTFIVSQPSGRLVLVSVGGATRHVVASTQTSPLQTGDVLITNFGRRSGSVSYVGVDPQTSTSHPVPIPYAEDKSLQVLQRGARLLWGTSNVSTIVGSPDGGATWRPVESPPGQLQLDPIDSADQSVLAFNQAGDDDSKHAGDLLRSTDSGASWQTLHPADLRDCFASWLAVTPDANLLVYVFDTIHGAALKPGLYESDSPAWASFHRVPVHDAGGSPAEYVDSGDLTFTTVDPSGQQSLYLDSRGGMLVSTDEGRTWRVTRLR